MTHCTVKMFLNIIFIFRTNFADIFTVRCGIHFIHQLLRLLASVVELINTLVSKSREFQVKSFEPCLKQYFSQRVFFQCLKVFISIDLIKLIINSILLYYSLFQYSLNCVSKKCVV